MRSPVLVLGFALLLLLVPAARAGDADVVTQLYDVGPLLQPDRPPEIQVLGLPTAGLALRQTEDDEEEPAAFLEGEALLELVHAAVPGGWDEDERTLLQLEGRQLIVRAGAEAHEGVAGLLGELWTEATRRIRVDGIRLVYDAGGRERLAQDGLLAALRAGRADAKTRDALVSAASESSSAAAVVRPGSAATLGRLRATSYVSDYAVEIAQDSVVGDPVIRTVNTGWFVGATPHLLQEGDVYLEVLAQTADLHEPMRRQPLEATPFGTVDLPTCRTLRLHDAARLRAGESLILGSIPRYAEGRLEVLVLTPTVRGGRALRRGLRRWDVSALTAMPPRWTLTHAVPNVRGVVNAGSLNPPSLERLEAAEPVTSVDGLVEAVTTSLGDEAWEGIGVWLAPWGRAVMARNEPGVLVTIERHIAERERVLGHESAVIRLLAEQTDGSEPLASATLALPHGRSVVWQAGVERAYVADWSVEVAQEARTGEPQIATVFGGLAFEARLDPAPVADRFALTLDLHWADLDEHMESRRTHNECTGIVDIPRIERLDVHGDLVIARGETQRFDAGTLADGRRLVVEVSLGR